MCTVEKYITFHRPYLSDNTVVTMKTWLLYPRVKGRFDYSIHSETMSHHCPCAHTDGNGPVCEMSYTRDRYRSTGDARRRARRKCTTLRYMMHARRRHHHRRQRRRQRRSQCRRRQRCRYRRVAMRCMSSRRSYGAIEFSSLRRWTLNIHPAERIPGTFHIRTPPLSLPSIPERLGCVTLHISYMPAG